MTHRTTGSLRPSGPGPGVPRRPLPTPHSDAPHTIPVAPGDRALVVQTVDRLTGEFGARIAGSVVAGVVSRCTAQLRGQGSPTPALPELVERLARAELADLLAAAHPTPAG